VSVAIGLFELGLFELGLVEFGLFELGGLFESLMFRVLTCPGSSYRYDGATIWHSAGERKMRAWPLTGT